MEHTMRQVRSRSSDAVNMLVKAFISCRLDYCNSLYGIFDGLVCCRALDGKTTSRRWVILSAAEMFNMDSLVSGDIKFMRIFARFFQIFTKISVSLWAHMSFDYLSEILKIATLWHEPFQIRRREADDDCGNWQISHRAVLRASARVSCLYYYIHLLRQ